MALLGQLLELYSFVLIVRVLLSWVAPTTSHPAIEFVERITEPVLAPIRRVVPPIGGIDLSVWIVLLAIRLLRTLL